MRYVKHNDVAGGAEYSSPSQMCAQRAVQSRRASQREARHLFQRTEKRARPCYDDHEPPHFHVRYGEQKAIITIDALTILRGQLGSRAHSLVMEWAAFHKAELLEDWVLAKQQAPLKKIKPLD